MDFLFNFNDFRTIFLISVVSIKAVIYNLCLFLAIFKSNFGLKKRSLFFFTLFSLLILEKQVLTAPYNEIYYLGFSMGILACFPLISIRKKRKKEVRSQIKKQTELARFIERSVKQSIPEIEDEPIKPSVISTYKPRTDFSHVIKVIKKLNMVELLTQERKAVNELESLILLSSNGEPSGETKQKINDGLGYLLKLMSKYHV